jgi:cytochrome c-type biogenesis protein CcsB
MSLATLDPVLQLLAAVAYAAAFVLLIAHLSLGKRTERAAVSVGVLGLVLHLAGIAVRWAEVGHGPIVTRYENLSSYALATAALALYFVLRKGVLRQVALALYPVAFLMLGLGLYSGPEAANMPPTFSGIWLVLHVCFYFTSFATAVTAVGASALIGLRDHLKPATLARYPGPEELDRTAYRYAGLAFTFWGIGMLTGAIWAYNAWGRYWGWDPVESWSLVTWLILGVYLHMRRFYGWEGRKASWLLLVSFVLVLVSLFGTTLLANSLHSVYFK